MEKLTKFSASPENGCKRDSMASACTADVSGAVAAACVNTPPVSAHTSTWLAALHVNNNNNNSEKPFSDHQPHKCNVSIAQAVNINTNTTLNSAWQCDDCDILQKNATSLDVSETLARVTLNEEDEGGGTEKIGEKLSTPHNGSELAESASGTETNVGLAPANASFQQTETDYVAYDMCGAVSLSPPLFEDHFALSGTAGVGVGGSNSNRTSLNNSTENLSYISDNFYGDDLILLAEDVDVDAEELSLNSDDCIYAYRGEGADFDLPLPPLTGVGGNFGLPHGNNAAEEETDFLEMDYEPDPLSELEYNHGQDVTSCGSEANDQYLLQRDNCHLVTPTQRHQLFSSPIDDLPPAPKALQAQSLLSTNFARITLHLDQIQKDYNDDLRDEGRERLNSALESRPLEEEFSSDVLTTDTSHSLPNTLHEHFTNRCNSESAVVNSSKDCMLNAPLQTLQHKSPTKMTGAKPKRLSTFSSTSSTSSKNSSKSRNSLRSAFQTSTLGAGCSFDERSVSCSEFRTERDLSANATINNPKQHKMSSTPHTAPSTALVLNTEPFNAFTDETCLDCLEKEFVATTIGKALDPQDCLKCRKHLGHLSLYNTTRSYGDHSKYRRSASPTTTFFFSDQPSPTSRLFSCEFLNSQARRRQEWDSYVQENKENEVMPAKKGTPAIATKTLTAKAVVDIKDLNQSLKDLESKLLKNIKPPDPCSLDVPTLKISETCIVQALDKLQVTYNHELLRKYFTQSNANYFDSSSTNISKTSKEFKNLKDFLLYVSKRQGNYIKLQRIIEKVTNKQVLVQFKKDYAATNMEMVTVRVSDILYYWSRHKNLDILKQMDKRYQDTNILGKIANIIRQAHQRSLCSSRRPLPEFISIPQYYPSGFLTLTKPR